MNAQTMYRFQSSGVVPVVVIENEKDALAASEALLSGGIGVMEITLRTSAALASINAISRGAPEVFLGAGTVLTLEACKASVDHGARFIVSPGFRADMVKWCVNQGVPVLPGCVTPTEIMAAMDLGLSVFKYFPANLYGGLKGMQALSAPFTGVRFIPTGGVNGENLREYLSAPYILAVGGSWLCAKADISAGNFKKIAALAKEASNIVKQTAR